MKKRIILWCWIFFWGILMGTNIYANTENNWFYYNHWATEENRQETEIGKIIKEESINDENSILNRLLSVFNLNTEHYQGEKKALYYAKRLLNFAITFVSFITLITLIYTFYMVLVGSDEQYIDKAKKTLKGLAIAILVMGLTRFIVSIIFYIYQKQAYVP